jgi:hypothetical protein
MKKPENPCAPECPQRTVTCKFDGTCTLWEPFEKQNAAYREHTASSRASMDVDRARAERILFRIERRHTR